MTGAGCYCWLFRHRDHGAASPVFVMHYITAATGIQQGLRAETGLMVCNPIAIPPTGLAWYCSLYPLVYTWEIAGIAILQKSSLYERL